MLVGCFCMFAVTAFNKSNGKKSVVVKTVKIVDSNSTINSRYSALYEQMNLDSLGLSQHAFNYALKGYLELEAAGEIKNDHILSIIDFGMPSSKKRLFVIDVTTGKLLFNTFVSHGRNSGAAMATEFSNDMNSFKSSLGFYITGDTYKGEHGYSLRLDGKEKGINDNAYNRSIVMHAANYVNDAVVKTKGFLGRSLGCPAVPPSLHKAIINAIKDGTCLFLYSPDQNYLTHSKFIAQPDSTQQPVVG